jgi:5-methylcytosine-specific restriction protein B
MSIHNCLNKILSEWPIERQKPFRGNELAEFIRMAFAEEIGRLAHSINGNLKIKASAGAGNWASVPWLAILDPRITNSTQHGVYPVYLFRADGSGVYLSLGQGTTDPTNQYGKVAAERMLRETASELRQKISKLSKWNEGPTDLRSATSLGRSYEIPNIGARLYEKGKVPSEETIKEDLLEMLSIYEEAVSLRPSLNHKEQPAAQSKTQKERLMVQDFQETLADAGFQFDETLPKRLASALGAKPFLLLTGLSGSGKTKLAQAFSKWVSASDKQYELIAVGADWTSNENLLGYPDALNANHYRKPDNGALDLILRAKDDPENPYFLILDEMNLSHVERYFADFLSAMESGEAISLHDGDADDLWDGVPAKLKIPKNLFVIGTVNVDETTYMFSPKVLDRANVIEFRVSDEEMKSFLENPVKPDLDSIAGQGAQYAKAFVAAATQKNVPLEDELKAQISGVLMEFFPQLKEAGAEFGYRTAHEICRFVYFHKELSGEDWEFNFAMDAAIMQKLLPKLHGSKKKLGPILDKLNGLCNARFPASSGKIVRMQKRLAEHGFTSFAEA